MNPIATLRLVLKLAIETGMFRMRSVERGTLLKSAVVKASPLA
jgi:hypothetical protein